MKKAQLTIEREQRERVKTMEKFKQSEFVKLIKGLWMVAEGVSLLTVAAYAVYQGHYANLPKWGSYGLTVMGVLVLVPAGILLSRFLRAVGKA